MKHLTLGLLFFISHSAHAHLTIEATALVDHGNYVEVTNPYVQSCSSGECYGGPLDALLPPSFSGNQICKALKLNTYIKGSKKIASDDVSVVYHAFDYYILERSGPPGEPDPEFQKVIVSLECRKP